MRTRLLTVAQLEQAGACDGGVKVFRKLFGDRVEVSVELAEKYRKELSEFVEWGAEHLLSEKGYVEYQKTTDAAYEEYRKIDDVAYEEYLKIRTKAFAKIYVEER